MQRFVSNRQAQKLVPNFSTMATYANIPIHKKRKELGIHYAVSDPKRIPVFANNRESVATVVGSDDAPTLVCVHGCPGSTFDWRYIGAKLEEEGARVIRLTIPGHDVCPRECSVVASPLQKDLAQAAWEMVDSALSTTSEKPSFPRDERVFIIGHSLGCETVAAMVQSPGMLHRIAGIAFVAPVGLYPHKAIRPFWAMRMLDTLSDMPLLRAIVPRMIYHIYVNLFGFPKRLSLEEVAWCQKRVANRDFEQYEKDLRTIAEAKLPVFIAYAKDDPLIEPPVTHTTIRAMLGATPERGGVADTFKAPLSRVVPKGMGDENEPEIRMNNLVHDLLQIHEYEKGGHNLIKSQSVPIGADLWNWIKNVIHCREQSGVIRNDNPVDSTSLDDSVDNDHKQSL